MEEAAGKAKKFDNRELRLLVWKRCSEGCQMTFV
jgi:hypothetical protein